MPVTLSSIAAVSNISLQSTLAAASATGQQTVHPHHPASCSSEGLWYHEDGRFSCEHAEAPSDDPRTQACLNHTAAILLFEIAFSTL